MFRCFKRSVWQTARTSGWPNDVEPLATPADKCRTLARFDDRQDAIDWCGEQNANRPYASRDRTKEQEQRFRLSRVAEFISED